MKKYFLKPLLIFSVFLALCVVSFTTAATVTYTYDDAGRLIKVVYGEGDSIEYTYDNAGNLLQRQVTVPQPDVDADEPGSAPKPRAKPKPAAKKKAAPRKKAAKKKAKK